MVLPAYCRWFFRSPGDGQKFRRWIDSDHVLSSWTVVPKISPGADPGLEDATFGSSNHASSINGKRFLPHRHVDEVGHNVICIETHDSQAQGAYRKASRRRGIISPFPRSP